MKKFTVGLVLMLAAALALTLAACTREPDEPDLPNLNVTVSGRIVDENGPVSQAKIALSDAANTVNLSVTTGADGKFSFSDVPKTKNYTLTVSKAGYYDKTVALTPVDINAGKNQMGDILFAKPTEKIELKGRTVSLDGITPVGGVAVKVAGFDLHTVSRVDGSFTIADVLRPDAGVTLKLQLSKEYYQAAEYELSAEQIADKDVGDLFISMGFRSKEGSLSSRFAFIRTEEDVRLIAEYSAGLSGGQHAQFHIHTGDDVNGKVYMILLAESRETVNTYWQVDAEYAMWVRTISKFAGSPDSDAEIHAFPNARLTVTDHRRLEMFIPYADLGITAEESIGVVAYSQVLSGDKSKWLWSVFGKNAPETGDNFFEYPMFYRLDKNGELSERDDTLQTISGRVVDEEGQPVPHAEIVLKSIKTELTATTAEDGTYRFENVSRVYALDMNVMKSQYNTAKREITPLMLQQENLNIDVSLTRVRETIRVTGNVKTILGENLKGVRVSLADSEGFVLTDNAGNYILEDVPADGEFVELGFAKDFYAGQKIVLSVAELKAGGNIAPPVSMYSEISPLGQKIRFASHVDDERISFRITTGAGFTGLELIWFEFQVGSYENGKTYILILSPDGAHVALEADTKSITQTGWCATSLAYTCNSAVNSQDNSAVFEIEVSIAQFAEFNDDGSIGVGISTALTDVGGNACFTGTGSIAAADVTQIQYHEFLTFTRDGSYLVRE